MNITAPVPLGPFTAAIVRSRWLDRLLRLRASSIMRKSQLGRHLPAQGLMLDLGAGFGHLAEAVRAGGVGNGRRCIALDPVWSPPPPLADRLMRGGPGWVRAMHAPGESLPFRSGCFDAAWCAFVLHHLAPTRQHDVLAELARVLRPGGTFVLIEDTPATETTLLADRRLNFEDAAAPHHYRAPIAWRTLLETHGFVPTLEVPFTSVFPRATLRRVQHRAFVCRMEGRAHAPAAV